MRASVQIGKRTDDEPAAKRIAFAIGVLFFTNGAVFSNWLPRIPEVRERLGVDNSGLGTALVGGGLGGLIASFLVAKVLARFGSRRLVLTAATALALMLPLISVVPTPFALAALLTALGLSDVFNDMAMNTQGVMVQGRLTQSIMHRLHGMWSFGFLTGSGVGSLASAAKVPIWLHLVAVSIVLLSAIAFVCGRLIPTDATDDPPNRPTSGDRTRRITPYMITMAIMAIGVAWIEIIPSEWSAVAMTDLFDAGHLAGVGTFTFACAMFVGRLNGDRVVERYGSTRMLDGSLVLVMIGAGIVIGAQHSVMLLAGLAVWGLGASVMFPQLYTMAGSQPGTAGSAALGAMGVGQRLGFMVGPFLAGQIAAASSLRWTFAATALGGFAVVMATRASTKSGAAKPA
jgi:predicted MFS family arabinose efflux permease